MGDKITKSPNIRFAGFTEAWEQRKLGEISDKVTEKNTKNFYDETFTNSAEFGIVTQRDFFNKDISNSKNLNGYYVVHNDDFVYNPRISNFAPVGPIKRNRLARTGVMSPLYYVFRTHDIDKTYLEHYFDTTCWHSFMKLNGDSGARADRFAIKDSVFIEMPIPFPSLEEQKKMAKFFDTITILITLHQRKLDLLKVTKKSMLQKMFPKDGESVPEIRFKGFTDDWEQRKLGESVNFLNGRAYKQSELLDEGKYRVLRVGNFNTNDKWYYSDIELEDNKYAVKSDLLYLWATNFGPEIWNEEKVIYHYHIWKLDITDENIDKRYLYTWLETDKERIKQNTNGSTMIHITKGNMEERVFEFPTLFEQQKIGSIFHEVDNLITLHQRELDLLKDLKKSMLQQMFI
ncbi:restriction endonuclease subunit S [Clostridium botulinum]|uniref:restriction endonuclease subunit S n=1 Tax=Clostridium botulinum TaxID=1491 RepID=UPI0006A4825A|nr:restriction endonuclease subunit S [Clostridium botulinum]KOC47616.1 hypothetical protein ADU88_09835 [Clostridium botulinum]